MHWLSARHTGRPDDPLRAERGPISTAPAPSAHPHTWAVTLPTPHSPTRPAVSVVHSRESRSIYSPVSAPPWHHAPGGTSVWRVVCWDGTLVSTYSVASCEQAPTYFLMPLWMASCSFQLRAIGVCTAVNILERVLGEHVGTLVGADLPCRCPAGMAPTLCSRSCISPKSLHPSRGLLDGWPRPFRVLDTRAGVFPLSSLSGGLLIQPGPQDVRVWRSLPRARGVRVSWDLAVPSCDLCSLPCSHHSLLSPQSNSCL